MLELFVRFNLISDSAIYISSFLYILVVAVEKVEFVRPLKDHKATRLGEDYTFEVELSRDHGRAQWLRDGMEIRSDKKYNVWNEAARHRTDHPGGGRQRRRRLRHPRQGPQISRQVL